MNKRKVYYDECEQIAWTHTPQGDKVIVSWADRHWIEEYSVNLVGPKRCPYASIYYQSKQQKLHRLIMRSQGYHGIVDHINRNTFDNRRDNLRSVASLVNSHNRSKRTGTSSRFLGVHWDKCRNKWKSQMGFNVNGKRKNKHLGYFSSEIDAARAYDTAVAIYQSPGATTNASLGLLPAD